MRLSFNDLAPQVANALSELGNLLQELNLSRQDSSLLSLYNQDGDYLNFNGNLSGAVETLKVDKGVPQFYQDQLVVAKNYEFRAHKILQALKNKYPNLVDSDGTLLLPSDNNLTAAQFLYAVLSNPQYVVVVSERDPVIIPFFSKEHFALAIEQPQERLNINKSLGVLSAIIASYFVVGSKEAQAHKLNEDLTSPTSTNSNNPDPAKAQASFHSHDNSTQSLAANYQSSLEQASSNSFNNDAQDQATSDINSLESSKTSEASRAGAFNEGEAPSEPNGSHNTKSNQEQENNTKSAALGASFNGGLIAFLIGLLLLLALLAFYFFKLYPWPFDNSNEQNLLLDKLNEQVIEDELNLQKINELIELTQAKLALIDEDKRSQELNDLQQVLAQDESNLSEVERLLSLIKVKDELLQKELASTELIDKPSTNDIKLEKTNVSAKLPKCETIVKQGKIPNLILIHDGSGSMIRLLPDNIQRFDAALKAANSLIDSVDKNVPIRLIGLQGCPLAIDYGVFAGNQRKSLKNALLSTRPTRYSITTPLVSGLRAMASAAPTNVESIGILISDGVDSCMYTERTNLCSLAKEIHRAKPLLKINVVLIGDDAPDAKCVADITGGNTYNPSNTNQLIKDLKNAGKSLQKVCY